MGRRNYLMFKICDLLYVHELATNVFALKYLLIVISIYLRVFNGDGAYDSLCKI